MKKFISVLLIVMFVVSLSAVAFAGGKMKGKISDITITLEDAGKKETFDCGKNCDIKTNLKADGKTEVTVEFNEEGGKKAATVVRRAVAGC